MTDLRVQEKGIGTFAITLDLLQRPDNLIDETQALATAVIVALGTDRRANNDDPLPDIYSDDRRGWWADTDAEKIWNGWLIGSRLWLLNRSKIVGSGSRYGATVARAQAYCQEALQPLITNRIASRIDVNAQRTNIERIDVDIVIYRGPRSAIQLQYQALWSEVGG
jgi:phage gp46-like protein